MFLLIFVRKGCCLCDNLKKKLQNINNQIIGYDLEIKEIDIDRFDLYQDNYKKYDLLVPVLALKDSKSKQIKELPRVSPRIKDYELINWLEKHINKLLN